MKTKFYELYNLIMEELQQELVKENVFNSNEFSKYNYTYARNVINDILNGNEIKLGKKGETSIKIKLDEESKNNLLELIDNPDIDKFNEILLKNTDNKISWTKIFKGTYSGHEAGKQSDGEAAEPYICYFFNNKIDKDILKNFKEEWQNSIVAVNNFLNKNFSSSDYIALQVNGTIVNNEKIDEDFKRIGKLFSGKFNEFNKELIFPKIGHKDNWNKADILLISKSDISNVINELSKINDFNNLNSYLNQIIEDRILIPISLKKLKENIKNIQFYFVDKENNDDKTQNLLNSIKDVSFIEGKVLSNINKNKNDKNATCWLKSDNGLTIQFRRQTGSETSNNLSIEVGGKDARGGKGVSLIYADLNIFKKDFYEFKDESDFKEKMNDIGINVNNLNNFKYISYQGFYSLYLKFKEKNENNNLIDFFKYVYYKCAGYECPVKFWILK